MFTSATASTVLRYKQNNTGESMANNDYTNIIEVADLLTNLKTPDWVIVDCRFDLTNPDWGFSDYQTAHIPGAVYAHLDRDLSGNRTPATGRHPLPDPQTFRETLGRLGINDAKQVVVYDTTGGGFAVRLWWMLNFFGHYRVSVLNGGFQAWQAENLPVGAGVHTNPKTKFQGEPNPAMVITTAEMEKIISTGQSRVIDARAPERFRGEVEPLDPVAGHIPGALNRFHQHNLGADGRLLPPDRLKREFLTLLDGVSSDQAVVYCGSGVTSCHHLLAMQVAGLPMARLYAGSWSEWIRDPKHAVALG